jgi:hypothetical protein
MLSPTLGGASFAPSEEPVISCPKCGKDNQDHYKFCLGCGAELPRDASPKKGTHGTPPGGVPVAGTPIADEATALGQGDPGPNLGGALPSPSGASASGAPAEGIPGDGPPVMCPQCSHPNPAGNKFCASCGFKLGRGGASAAPAAPPPGAGAVASAQPAAAGGRKILLTALRADGTEAGQHEMYGTTNTLGRDSGGVFAGDSYLSPRHATFVASDDGRLRVRDESSLNGIYRRVPRDEGVPLPFGAIFRIGQEIVRIEELAPLPPNPDGVERLGSPAKGYVGRLAMIIGRDATGNAYPIPEGGLHLGRERGDVLFPEDGYVSGLHCKITYENDGLLLTDLGSSNGTFVRLIDETELLNGDILLMGQQLFRIAM